MQLIGMYITENLHFILVHYPHSTNVEYEIVV